MIILGISFLSDASACLLIDGKVVAAISEERINRKKLWNGIPEESIKQVLDIGKIKLSDVDCIATHGSCSEKPNDKAFKDKIEEINSSDLSNSLKKIQVDSLNERYEKELDVLSIRTPGYIKTIKKLHKNTCIFEHHEAHAATAYYGSGWDKSYILTADGWGEDCSSSFWKGSGGRIRKISSTPTIDSLGYFYGSITKSLGFIPHRHEGKVLGLAAYNTSRESYKIIKDMISYKSNHFVFNAEMKKGIYKPSYYNPELDVVIRSYPREDVASSVQKRLEEVVLDLISDIDDSDINISLAGGVFANVKLNQRIKDHPSVGNVYVFPNMGDGGLSIGAAWLAYTKLTDKKPKPLNTALLGNSITDDNVLIELKKENLIYKKETSINKVIARLLADGEVVIRASGPMEFGPRALGNRSILYQATDGSVNNWLNKHLKRSEFMPFAPMTLIDDVDEYYLNISGAEVSSKFMTITLDCTQKMIDEAPAAVHVDKTARPQFITKSDYPAMYEIISEYKKLSGFSNIINTSFNMHEEPIVSTVVDAIKAFKDSGIKWMAIGSYIVKNS